MRNKNYGFTLIELLIVIGILGILAAGLLAAVDPFEQLKKGRDTNRRNIVVEMNNAMIRYYATHGDLPFAGASPVCTGQAVGIGKMMSFTDLNDGVTTKIDAAGTGCLAALVNDGEIKADFVSGVGAGDMAKFFVYSETGVDLAVCFAPESKSSYNDPAAKWLKGTTFTDESGTGGKCTPSAKAAAIQANGVPAYTDVANACFWCAK